LQDVLRSFATGHEADLARILLVPVRYWRLSTMTITHVPELNSTLWRLGLYGNAGQPSSTASASAGATSLLSGSPSQGGGFAGAIVQALSQMGVSGAQSALGASPTNASSSSSGPSGSPSASTASQQNQALRSFMQSLLAALQTQAAVSGTAHGVSAASSFAASSSGHRHGHSHTGGGLQSLIQELSASSSAATTATSPAAGSQGSGTTTASVANATLTALQQSFNNLVSAVGGSGGQASLGTFLTTLANNLSSGARTANLVSTHA
jgi:hypothetical protein